ncbi:NAD-dependent epimerase/dehydratase family protein [uncultured Algibacter sp.]|uniref:NAD-dependent epimerase/dehydratase family protein n=1 Tax=uncultured Algibacter sp. TaxID=298659 RepID=UPI003217142E
MILVTGGTGLVGAHLLYKLVHNKQKIKAIYRDEQKFRHVKQVFSCYSKDYETLFNSITWVEADLLDITELTDAFIGVTKVYHCAALVSFQPNEYKLLRQTNIEGTANIVNMCLAKSVDKLCYVSSIATLGNELNNKPITEDSTWSPEAENSAYAITKYGAEMEVWRATQEGLNAVIVNPGVIIGPGIWQSGSGSLFKKAHKGIPCYTAGTIGLVGVDDVVSIMIMLMDSTINSERFVLVAENWSYKTFLKALALSVNSEPSKKLAHSNMLALAWRLDWLKQKLTGKKRQLTKRVAKSLNSETYYNSDKIKTTLNYKFNAIDKTIANVGSIYLKQV